jgi:hypothetical protein
MMPKSRHSYGRSRLTPRDTRRPAPADEGAARLAALGRVAARFVAARWPELASVTPVITAPADRSPSAALLARLGLDRSELATRHGPGEYTFTFALTRPCADGADAPLVATVTVDAQRRIVKSSVTR